MFICNVKMNKKLFTKLLIAFFVIVIIIVFIIVGHRFYNNMSRVRVNDDIPTTSSLEINCNNYTNILKDSHENIDKYVGKKIKFVGFVYRLYDFSENQFVLAREMIISSDNQAVVVGFLSDYKNANDFEDGTWVEAEGVIEKGNYHGDLPVIKINSLKEVPVPSDEYVFPPSDSYVSSEI